MTSNLYNMFFHNENSSDYATKDFVAKHTQQ